MIAATDGTNGAVLAPTNGHRGTKGAATPPKSVRCAIYTRKSTDEGLDQDFNSLDAQRESCASYIASQKHEGWVMVPDRFDDGGFTGANIERPALKRLMAKVEAGEVDVVVIYKLDRLTRSIRDFGRIMDVFEVTNAKIVAVTQEINTTTSIGRLNLHVLLSFAQFEREMTGERTRDKIRAARRKGKWTGGYIPLGYDQPKGEKRIVPNEDEAETVREIFRMYLEMRSLTALVTELNRRGWTTKRWTTLDGKSWGGQSWSKGTIQRLLTNRNYIGQVRHGSEYFPAEHAAILDESLFNKVQTAMGHGRKHGAHRNSFGYLLKGLLICGACGSAMTPTTTQKENVSYRYYRCVSIEKKGTDACPVRYAPAEPLEQFVVDHLRQLGKDPALVEEAVKEAEKQIAESLERLTGEKRRLEAEGRRVQGDAKRVTRANGALATAQLAELEERQGRIEARLHEIDCEARKLKETRIDPMEAAKVLEAFDSAWDVLEAQERERLIGLVVESVKYHGASGNVAVTFNPLGFSSMGREVQGVAVEDVA